MIMRLILFPMSFSHILLKKPLNGQHHTANVAGRTSLVCIGIKQIQYKINVSAMANVKKLDFDAQGFLSDQYAKGPAASFTNRD